MKTSMKVWITVATWFCFAILFGFANKVDSETTAKKEHPLGFDTVSFTTSGATGQSYSNFMKTLRDKLDSGKRSHSIPLLREASKVLNANRFVLVTLSNSKVSATIALDVVDIYVVGYQVGNHAYFFSDISTQDISDLFKDLKKENKIKFPFTGSYLKIPARREDVDLGNPAMDKAIQVLYDSSSNPNTVAPHLLVVIQMVSEAARFSFIERQIVNNFAIRFRPLANVFSRQNKWGKLSSAIQASNNAGEFQKPVELERANGKPYNVTSVSQIRPDIALLKFDTGSKIGEVIWPFFKDFI